jgi:uncharacterized delta-60 repeat protein
MATFTAGEGKITTDFGGADTGFGVTLQSDGKILVTGDTMDADDTVHSILARYNVDGSLDSSFSGDGKVIIDLGTESLTTGIAVQNDGKILMSGAIDGSAGGDFFLTRYNADGTPDSSFSGDGRVSTDFGSLDVGFSVATQTDGKIVVAGISNSDFALARYNSDGNLDASFSGDGMTTTDFGGAEAGGSVIVQNDGKILVAGVSLIGSNWNFAVARYNATGSLDSTFSGDGKVLTAFGINQSSISLALQADGKIVVAGGGFTGGLSFNGFGVIRYNSDGTLDTSFSGDGYVVTDFAADSAGQSVKVQADGRILVGGFSNGDFALVRYNSNGTLDTTFSGDGKVTTDFGDYEAINSIVIQSDGKIVAAGLSGDDMFMTIGDVALARYNADGTLDTGGDTTPPTVVTFSPADGATEVAVGQNIVATFSEAIQMGAGTIAIHSGSAVGPVVESYNVATSTNLAISENTLTINPTANLEGSTHYYVTLDAGSINDFAGNGVVGSTYNFTTDGPIVETEILFSDEFNSQLNAASWDYNHWQEVNNPSFYGRTQQRDELPDVSNGELHLELDTFNPSYDPFDPKQVPSFYGSEAITKQTFSNNTGGIVFEIKAHFVNPVDGGIVGGMFSYSLNSGNRHDEIDFEAVSNKPDQIQTNIYANEPLGAGHPQFNPIFGALTDAHIYRIEWFKNAIRWFVDGQLVRVESDYIPQQAMPLHLNIWAPAADWIEAYNGALNPVTDPTDNTAYFFDIDSVRVARLSSTYYYSDVIAPNLISANPVDGATNVAVGNDIVFTFSEAIQQGAGTIAIHSGSAVGPVVESYNVATSTNLAISGSTLTINPTSNLANNTHYFVTFTDGCVKDLEGNNYAGTTTYDFTTSKPAVLGGSGNDSFDGALGDQAFNGFAGTDTVVYSGPSSRYIVIRSAEGYSVLDTMDTDGDDSLLNIEKIQFSDKTLSLSSAASTVTPIFDIEKLYVAYFGRPGDPLGLDFWIHQIETQPSSAVVYADISKAFAGSAEYQATYGGMSAYQTVAKIYNNLLNREPDLVGQAYWGDKMIHGDLTVDSVVEAVVNSALNGPNVFDKAAVHSKIDASVAFTEAIDTLAEVEAYAGSAACLVTSNWLAAIESPVTMDEVNDAVADMVAAHNALTQNEIQLIGVPLLQ